MQVYSFNETSCTSDENFTSMIMRSSSVSVCKWVWMYYVNPISFSMHSLSFNRTTKKKEDPNRPFPSKDSILAIWTVYLHIANRFKLLFNWICDHRLSLNRKKPINAQQTIQNPFILNNFINLNGKLACDIFSMKLLVLFLNGSICFSSVLVEKKEETTTEKKKKMTDRI